MQTLLPIDSRLPALLAVILLVAGIPVLSATGTQESDDILIGISKFVVHPALDAVEAGIQDELAERGRDNVVYDLQNSNADVSTGRQIAGKFKADRVDLAVGIATPTAQALKAALDDIPVVYTAITDPVSAGLVESLDQGEAGIAGVSHRTPVQQQIEFMMSLRSIRALGHVYSSGEANAVFLAEQTRRACENLGIEFISQTITNPAEVRQATQSIIGRVDAIYVSTDNQVVSALSALTDVAMQNQVAVLSADPASAETNEVFVAWGFDWYQIGRITGGLIDRILQGEDPGSIPTILVDDPTQMNMILNLDVARELGIEISEEVMDQADRVVEDGEIRSR
jgi:putative tryptophan/tyrosine transport system substrate-binding protein